MNRQISYVKKDDSKLAAVQQKIDRAKQKMNLENDQLKQQMYKLPFLLVQVC